MPSKIEWTNETWNPVTGCTKVSTGCKHCYAETIAKRFWGDRKFTDIICHEDRLEKPLRWKKPRMIFVNSMSDLFHEEVPHEFIIKVFRSMAKAKHHTYQILTKRAERMRKLLSLHSPIRMRAGRSVWCEIHPRELHPHIWLGVSVENQQNMFRIAELVDTPGAVRWISAEPLLGLLVIPDYLMKKIDWVVVGGESGPGCRPMEIEWARDLRDQCQAAGVAFFMKQLGGHPSKRGKFEDLPEDLRIREYPKTK